MTRVAKALAAICVAGLLPLLLAACSPRATPTATPGGFGGRPGPTATPTRAPTPTPTRPPGVYPTPTVAAAATPTPHPLGTPTPTPGASLEPPSGPTHRIIVRTVDTTLVVDEVSGAMDRISSLADEFGGWVVSSGQTQRSSGSISLRVPAERLDEAIVRLKALAKKVESLNSTSQDFTDEYVDSQARVRGLQATQATLIGFLDKAQNVEEALQVQAELANIQQQIEQLQGRLGFLDQASAYSLVNVKLKLAPMAMGVNAGPDIVVKAGEPVKFVANFTPPDGITDFSYSWDFGDAYGTASGARTAPQPLSTARTTSVASYTYGSSKDSPYIVTVKVQGTGDAGAAEGTDTLIVRVLDVKPIEVYAGPDQTVTEGGEATFDASFTRPAGLSGFRYSWDFGDGSAPVTGDVPADSSSISVKHSYKDYRPSAFVATLTVTADSEAGPIEGRDAVEVSLKQAPDLAGSWAPGATSRSAVHALTRLGQGAATVGIWLGIFSPIWLTLATVAIVGSRRRKKV